MKINVRITREENAKFFGVDIDEIVEVDFEEYVAAVVASEIGNSHIEACKAQAVASRTFAYRYINKTISDSSSSAQAYRAARYDRHKYPNAIEGTKLTSGELLYYNNKPITAVFSASNGGQTVSSKERWGTNFPYLISQPDPWNREGKKTGHGVGMSQKGIKNAATLGISYREMLAFYYPGTILKGKYGETALETTISQFELEQLYKYLQEFKKQIM